MSDPTSRPAIAAKRDNMDEYSLSTLTYANNPSMTSRTKNLLCRKAQRGKHTDLGLVYKQIIIDSFFIH